MVRTAEELSRIFMELFPDDNRDEVIAFLEDITDSMASSRIDESKYVTKEKYDETVKELKDKYKRRFMGEVKEEIEEKRENNEEIDESITVDDLFNEKEDK